MKDDIMNDKRKARYDRRAVQGVAPHTPNRKCLRGFISPTGTRSFYLHVTKGWKTRRIVEVSMQPFYAAIARAQLHKANKNA